MAPRFDRTPNAPGPLVRGFQGSDLVIDGQSYRAALLTPQAVLPWDPPLLAELTEAALAPLLALQPLPEFILLGTGPTTSHPPRALVRALEERGVGVEAMDSRAAARTWAVLRAEERWIAAALMPL